MKLIILWIVYVNFYSRGLKILLSAVFCFLFCTVQAYSVKSDYLPVGLGIRMPDQGFEEIDKLRDVMESAAIVELEREGFEVVLLPSGAYDTSETEEEYFKRISVELCVSAIIVLTVAVEEPDLRIEIAFHVPSLPEVKKSTNIEIQIDLALDTVIAEALQGMMGQARSLIPVHPVETEVVEPEVVEPEVVEPEVVEPEVIEPEVIEPEVIEPEASAFLFRVSAGAAPFIAVGKINYYFNLGIMAALQGGFRIQTDVGAIEPGITAGVIYFEALGLEAVSKTSIFPAGAGLRWATSGENLSIYLTLFGGAAFLYMYVSEAEQFIKTDGYLSAGAGARMVQGDFWGFTAEVLYLIVFEDYYPIMGIAPSLYFDILF